MLQSKQPLKSSNKSELEDSCRTVLMDSNKNSHLLDEFLNITQVSKLIGLEESTIYGLTSKRKIPHYKPGKKLLFKRSEILAWIDKSRQATADEIINQSKTESNG
jgi:excisionase family DNA binding protein